MKSREHLYSWSPMLASLAVHAGIFVASWLAMRTPHSVRISPTPPGTQVRLLGVSVIAKSTRRSHTAPAKTATPVHAHDEANTPVEDSPHVDVESPGAPELATGATATLLEAYAYQVRSRIGAHLDYPISLRRRGVVGRVFLRLTLDATGTLRSREVSSASGSTELDQLAIAAVDAAQPYPEPASELRRPNGIVLSLPIEFKIGQAEGP